MTTAQEQKARAEAFGYTCRACSRCCAHKIIQVNPYEIARLARLKGLTSAEFRAAYTEGGQGAILRRTDDTDTCVFFDKHGCSVHPERPLVCRLYPLGRIVAPDETERWRHATPHPQSEGIYTKAGTIGDFIEGQGAIPYMRAADAYARWVREASALLAKLDASPGQAELAEDLLDMDAAIAAHCAATGEPEPADIEQRHEMHITILYRQLENLKGANDE